MLVLPLINPLVGEKVILCMGLLASIAYVSHLNLLVLTNQTTPQKRKTLMVAFAVQALFYGLAWAAWVCTYLMNLLHSSFLNLFHVCKKDFSIMISGLDVSIFLHDLWLIDT
jgi:hypothetical protein